MLLPSRSPRPQQLPQRCPRSFEESPPPVSVAIGPGKLSATRPGNGGSVQQTEYVIDRCALPESRRSMDVRAPCAAEREPGRWRGHVHLQASRTESEATP